MNNPVKFGKNITLYHGDCLDILPTLTGVDAIVTDPPYGHGWEGVASEKTANRKWNTKRKKKIIGHNVEFDPSHLLGYKTIVLWGANHYANKLPNMPAWLVWDKREGTTSNNQSDCEMAWCNVGGSARLIRHMWNGLCRASEVGKHYHVTQKPVVVMGWCIDKAKIKPGQTVCDPYMGSATTGIACYRKGIAFVGIEKDREYFDIACNRIDDELRQGTLFNAA